MRRLLMLGLCIGLMQTSVWAKDAPSSVDKSIRHANADMAIKTIRTTPIAGLYELRVGNQLFYAEKTGRYLIAGGHIFDTESKKDLTKARLEVINKVNWNDLPLDKAIVSGDPDGKELAVFTDPDCPYCRQLEKSLLDAKGIKIYTFLFPLESLHPKARGHAASIWCAKNQHAALQDLMLNGKKLPEGKCDTPIDAIQKLAANYGIRGTPTMISRDGRKRSGAASPEQLLQWLNNK
ncbi:MAG: DsbC family protein [Mariprofundaceae bacterium]|nr:DsbC family protein [Mariprofundaceae bacterium]